jgi:hypothetical protein
LLHLYFLHTLGGSAERCFDAGAEILCADVAIECRLLHELARLRRGFAEEQGTAGIVKLLGEIFQHFATRPTVMPAARSAKKS